MSNLGPSDKFQQMHDEHERTMRQIRGHQRLYPLWSIMLGMFILAGLAVTGYVGYRVLSHFGIL